MAVSIAVGQFHIDYETFAGYCAPGENVRRPLFGDTWTAVRYRQQKAGWTPVPVQVEIPEGITIVGEDSFEACYCLTAVTIPSTVVQIGKGAFRDCSSLAHVHLPDTVQEIGNGAFAGCNALEEITLPKALSKQAKRIFGDLEVVSWRWFSGKLQVNPELAKTLGADLKRRRETIASDVISSEDVKTLDRYLGLWDKVPLDFLEELIERSVKAQKASITAMLLQYKNTRYSQARSELARQQRVEKELGIRERSVTEWHRFFVFHEEDGEIVITGCKKYSDVVVVPEAIGGKPVTAINRWIPRQRKEPEMKYSVILPEGVREIGREAFQNCNLESITIPKTVREIGAGAFSHCKNLTKVALPPRLECITDGTFLDCKALTSVSIPESVREVDLDAFCECPALLKVALPSGVRKVRASRWRWEERSNQPYWSHYSRVTAPRLSVTASTLREANVDFVRV